MKPKYLGSSELMDHILDSLEKRKPLAVVSVGATETFVMAQYNLLSEEEMMNHLEAEIANKGVKRGHDHRGIRFPNVDARDQAVEAMKSIDIAGYNLLWYDMDSGELTERVFDHYNIWPPYYFECHLRRVIMISQKQKFQKMLTNHKVLIIAGYADEVKVALEEKGYTVTGAIKIEEIEDIPRVKEELKDYEFDLCLIAAGTSAIILGAHIKNVYGKVVFDLGQGMETLITNEIQDSVGVIKNLGLDKLLSL
ncbi:GT-D fold domain-containing glycosyltransferase [Bacillus timonensis]|uniref:GT-D fold domain-containing glycosyltransferase n=1 Tax=Bacillus timonensis TaxID=1033734 RepID=UPI000289BD4E|nr:GT-D fold domain-containing glycosyltransferase [Bacillus timonensis]